MNTILRFTPMRSLLITTLVLTASMPLSACRSAGTGQEEQAGRPLTSVSTNSGIDDSRRNAITRAIEQVSPAVVGINVTEVREYREMDPFWRFFYGDRVYRENVQSLGSGFIVSSDGYIITNDHVAGNASKIVVTMTDGTKHDARVVGSDRVTDICLIKIDDRDDMPYLKLGNSDDVIVGEWSIAFGNPFGLFSSSAKPTVTVGVISATHLNLDQRDGRVYRNMIQTDAAINSGNSGGPLVNSLGEVIGVNTVIFTPNQGSVGLGFAVPINLVREVVETLRAKGTVDRNFYAGMRVQTVNQAIARAYRLERPEGVIVAELDRRGSAFAAGLEIADIIVRANGEPVVSAEALDGLITYSRRGDVLELEVLRSGSRKTIRMELKPR
jgi:serine protease Do